MSLDKLSLEEVIEHLKAQAEDKSWSGLYVSAPAAEALDRLKDCETEQGIVRRLDFMAAESLPPEIFNMWQKVFETLCKTRKNLKFTAPF